LLFSLLSPDQNTSVAKQGLSRPRSIQPPSAGKKGIDGFKGGLSANNYISISKTSRATATRDLQDLCEKGALVKIGELRHTRYFLNINERSES
jgi:Fic family protein